MELQLVRLGNFGMRKPSIMTSILKFQDPGMHVEATLILRRTLKYKIILILFSFILKVFQKVFVVSGGVTAAGFTDTTEKSIMPYTSREWTVVGSATLPKRMAGAAIVSIYNKLYLTG